MVGSFLKNIVGEFCLDVLFSRMLSNISVGFMGNRRVSVFAKSFDNKIYYISFGDLKLSIIHDDQDFDTGVGGRISISGHVNKGIYRVKSGEFLVVSDGICYIEYTCTIERWQDLLMVGRVCMFECDLSDVESECHLRFCK